MSQPHCHISRRFQYIQDIEFRHFDAGGPLHSKYSPACPSTPCGQIKRESPHMKDGTPHKTAVNGSSTDKHLHPARASVEVDLLCELPPFQE